eukprot:scaffold217050_cov30-Tisochrysis_lutea.AAC.1
MHDCLSVEVGDDDIRNPQQFDLVSTKLNETSLASGSRHAAVVGRQTETSYTTRLRVVAACLLCVDEHRVHE